MNDYNQQILSHYDIGDLRLRNRLAVAPMTRVSATEAGLATPEMARYYERFAKGDFGLIITEGLYTDQKYAQGYPFQPGISDVEQALAWRVVTDLIHAHKGAAFAQLMHAGALSQGNRFETATAAPSSVRPKGTQMKFYYGEGQYPIPQAMTDEDIADAITGFAQAATLATRDAGFDGVEIHGANGYLLDQFLRDSTNHRTDHYGGSIENRARLTLEVTDAIVKIWGNDRVGIRLSPVTPDAGNTPPDSNVMALHGYLIQQLNAFNLAYLHFVEGATATSREVPEGVDMDALSAQFNGFFIGNNNYDLEMAIERRAQGKIDAVAFGRLFISNPDLVERLRRGAELTIAPRESYYGGGAKGYTDWPVGNY